MFTLWKNLRLKSQISIIQSLVVAIIFVISISMSFYLVQIFANFIKYQLLQQLVLKSRITTIKDVVIRVDRIGLIIYNQFLDHSQHYKNLYAFQNNNNLQIDYKEEDCVYFHFCDVLLGLSDLEQNQIRSYFLLQSQFIPFVEGQEIKAIFNVLYDKEIVFYQDREEIVENLSSLFLNTLNFMKKYKLPNFLSQLPNRTTEQILLSLQTIDENKIILGSIINSSDTLYYKLTQSEQYFKQRSMSVLENGLIISDTQTFNAFGKWFNNTNFTGFNNKQFQQIKYFANKIGTIEKECQFGLSQMLCLIDSNNRQQLVFSRYINLLGSNPYFVIIIVDAIFLNRIEDEFNKNLKQLTHNILTNIGLWQVIAYVICLLIQMIIIQRLNKPLEELKRAAKSRISNYQLTLEKMASIHIKLNQIQKLTKAFYNLIHRTHHHKIKPSEKEFENSQCYQGLFPQQEIAYILTVVRRYINKHF